MRNQLVTTPEDYECIKDLMGKDIPAYRKAYSDRTAWLMACLAELAYCRFNPILNKRQEKYLFEKVETLSKKMDKRILNDVITSFSYDPAEELKSLEESLASLNLELVKTYDNEGTQAFLAYGKDDNYLFLSFRGTESTSIKDIKSDAKANQTTCETSGDIHCGFKEAFEKVHILIQQDLDQERFSTSPLFITGHSLGGALATVAAKKLKHEGGIASCYTFGSPRVGDDEWIKGIKTSVYRVVNAADCVTMLPPGSDLMTGLNVFIKRIPYIGKTVSKTMMKLFGDYMHCGDMRYLTNCPSGQFAEVSLLFYVSLFYRIKGFLYKQLPWKSFLSDHKMTVYRKKLEVIAKRRNGLVP
jgi:triacylglycerol lipase